MPEPSPSPFDAIADPTRRELLLLLRDGECSASELAEPFPATRSAISQHLKVLLDAGLVARRKEGRRRLYRLTPEPLDEVAGWMRAFDAFWDDRLERLAAHLAGEAP